MSHSRAGQPRIPSTAVVLTMILLILSHPSGTIAANPEPVYFLPAAAGTTLIVAQGNGQGPHRTAPERFAFDLVAAAAPLRFPVLAARGGTVMSVRTNVRGGGCSTPATRRPDCWRAVNHVLIDHGDGTSGLYLHLRPADPVVRRGEVVRVGQHIGNAGSSGWTDRVGVQFQLQETPTWDARGSGGWFQTTSLPVAFADPDVVAQRPDGVPLTDDAVVSGNPGAAFEPFRLRGRPSALPATVPVEPGVELTVSSAPDADALDGYGFHLATDGMPAAVRPLFGGELAFAGCATGASASLGGMVVIARDVDGVTYHAVLGHLSSIEPALLDHDPAASSLTIGPNDVLGTFGAAAADLDCPPSDGSAPDTPSDLFAAILRDAAVGAEGEIIGGTPVSLEPLVGQLGYEGLRWWSGPLVADEIAAGPGRPHARWNRQTAANGEHIPFGELVRMTARVRDGADIAEVRFRAWYPRWPRVGPSRQLTSFDPGAAWRVLAVCRPPTAADRSASGAGDCTWRGDATDALVTVRWDPTVAQTSDLVPWLPRARTAMSRAIATCVPVSLAVEVIDRAGQAWSEIGRLPLPATCDARQAGGAGSDAGSGRVVYLDPLVPPNAPRRLSAGARRQFAPRPAHQDPEPGIVRWRDRADNEDGYRVYARRSYFTESCEVARGPWVAIEDLPPDSSRYAPRHARMIRLTPVDLPDAPGRLTSYELYISAFNEAGESERVRMGTFQKERIFFCDAGQFPPDIPLARSER